MARLFLDMDGTLAKFHDEAEYLERMYEEGFFAELAPFENMVAGTKLFMKWHPDVEVNIISSCIDSPFCIAEKNKWLDEHLPIPADRRIFPPVGVAKADYIPGGVTKDDFLLDDYNRGLNQFMYDGGSAIKCHNNINQKGRGAYGGSAGNLWVGPMVHVDDKPELIAAELSQWMGLSYDLEVVKSAYPECDFSIYSEVANPLDEIRFLAGKDEFFTFRLTPANHDEFYVTGHLLRSLSINIYGDEDYREFIERDTFGIFSYNVLEALEQAQKPLIGRIDYLDKHGDVDHSAQFRSKIEMDLVLEGCRAAGVPVQETWYVKTKEAAKSRPFAKDGSLTSKILNAEQRSGHGEAAGTGIPQNRQGR